MKRFIIFIFTVLVLAGLAGCLYVATADELSLQRETFLNGAPEKKQQALADGWALEKMQFRASLMNDTAAQFALAKAYRAEQMVRENPQTSAYWLQRAAMAHNAEASMLLARYALTGYGVEKNEKNAAGWVIRAAEDGSSEGAGMAGMLYLAGIGVEQDFDKAHDWLVKSNDPKAIDMAYSLQQEKARMQKLPEGQRATEEDKQRVAAREQIRDIFFTVMKLAAQTVLK